MSWQLKRQYIDGELGHHVIEFENGHTGATHITQVVVGHTGCPLCGHVHVADVKDLDVKAIIRHELDRLAKSHQQVLDHARKHQLAIEKAK